MSSFEREAGEKGANGGVLVMINIKAQLSSVSYLLVFVSSIYSCEGKLYTASANFPIRHTHAKIFFSTLNKILFDTC